jgi:hypothetical protein
MLISYAAGLRKRKIKISQSFNSAKKLEQMFVKNAAGSFEQNGLGSTKTIATPTHGQASVKHADQSVVSYGHVVLKVCKCQ